MYEVTSPEKNDTKISNFGSVVRFLGHIFWDNVKTPNFPFSAYTIPFSRSVESWHVYPYSTCRQVEISFLGMPQIAHFQVEKWKSSLPWEGAHPLPWEGATLPRSDCAPPPQMVWLITPLSEWMPFRLATVASSNPFNSSNAHSLHQKPLLTMRINKDKLITAHHRGKLKWHSFTPIV